MQANWQLPVAMDFSASTPAQTTAHVESVHARDAPPPKKFKVGFDYRLIYGVCFCLFLWIGLMHRINPLQWRRPTVPREHRSLLSEVRAEAHHCATMSFQG
jgi:hypothetical protein